MTTLTFGSVSQEQIDNLVSELNKNGTSVIKNSSTGEYDIVGHGVKATATFNEGNLSVNVLSKPFYVSIGHLKESIAEHLVLPTPSPTPVS
jgi:hypothetical protein